jgi:basic membrane protein A
VPRRSALALLALSTLLLAGCGGSSGGKSSSGGKRLKIGIVTDTGQLNDRGFNQLAFAGLQRAEKQLGVEGRVFQSSSAAEYVPNLSRFAQLGYDLVVGVGYTEQPAMQTVAKKFPKTHFTIVDVSQADLAGKPKNVVGLLFKEQEVGYLAGYLAGLEAKRLPGPDIVSSVGGERQPPVDRFIAGYQAGAAKADPGIKTVNSYSQDFTDQTKCKELALNQIAAGSVAVFQVAGNCGLGVLDAAKEKGVWAIGVDADQSYLGPEVLTSATKGVDTAVFDTIKAVKDGTFKGGRDDVFGLNREGVGLGKISPKVPKSEVDAVNKIRAQLVAGKIQVPTAVG